MILGIVGHAADKFSEETEILVHDAIINRILTLSPEKVVSGGCHLGGVDSWAKFHAEKLGVPFEEFLPKQLRWEPHGYKERNLKIASTSDRVICVVVKHYPDNFRGMRFQGGCYHCKDRNPPHVKSGGCWTTLKAKEREWIFI